MRGFLAWPPFILANLNQRLSIACITNLIIQVMNKNDKFGTIEVYYSIIYWIFGFNVTWILRRGCLYIYRYSISLGSYVKLSYVVVAIFDLMTWVRCILARTCTIQWNDDIRFVQDQHAQLDLYSAHSFGLTP